MNLMLLNCGIGEDLIVSWTARRSNQSTLKENQSWIFTGRTDAEAEAPILWPPDMKSRLIGKDSDAGKDWRQKEKRMAEDEMAWLNGHEFEQTLGDSEVQGSLQCCSPGGHKEADITYRLNNNRVKVKYYWHAIITQ